VTPFDNEAMQKIFGTLVDWWMKKNSFNANIVKLRQPMVVATIEIYDTVQRELLPTPAKSHYTFNLRDVSKVRGGACAPRLCRLRQRVASVSAFSANTTFRRHTPPLLPCSPLRPNLHPSGVPGRGIRGQGPR
jgi:hypothetical protein